eukprot:TRINITY_DN8139_c0_g1_i1.p1 TRINITY_DN8139_c0_g1~~TRINITY_DN8139_c0_g1_i1.p1  ORF type:complete len:611 (+),score=143.27 TRINITY_DN8139_c0_g1_i1:160-1833(+)
MAAQRELSSQLDQATVRESALQQRVQDLERAAARDSEAHRELRHRYSVLSQAHSELQKALADSQEGTLQADARAVCLEKQLCCWKDFAHYVWASHHGLEAQLQGAPALEAAFRQSAERIEDEQQCVEREVEAAAALHDEQLRRGAECKRLMLDEMAAAAAARGAGGAARDLQELCSQLRSTRLASIRWGKEYPALHQLMSAQADVLRHTEVQMATLAEARLQQLRRSCDAAADGGGALGSRAPAPTAAAPASGGLPASGCRAGSPPSPREGGPPAHVAPGAHPGGSRGVGAERASRASPAPPPPAPSAHEDGPAAAAAPGGKQRAARHERTLSPQRARPPPPPGMGPAAGDEEAPQSLLPAQPELRVDREDGELYCYEDFLQCYGPEEAQERWASAEPQMLQRGELLKEVRADKLTTAYGTKRKVTIEFHKHNTDPLTMSVDGFGSTYVGICVRDNTKLQFPEAGWVVHFSHDDSIQEIITLVHKHGGGMRMVLKRSRNAEPVSEAAQVYLRDAAETAGVEEVFERLLKWCTEHGGQKAAEALRDRKALLVQVARSY